MSNQKRLEEYLVGEKGYLKNDISNAKVIMLSGKWGSGKTHFWQNKIQTVLNDEKNKIPNHYISLYGKISIQEIKNEIFLKIFESVDSFKPEEKTKKIVKGSIDLVSSLTKSISVFGMSLDLSKITDKSFEKIDSILNNEKLKRTENYLNSGAIICFDDFERKSKDIDLNDLFGFITQLTLNFDCKVVIILNDDVFEGVEKDVFSRVKEKSVSKFLKYEPSIEELFNLIFDEEIEKDGTKEKKYKDLKSYREIILKTIEETEELNARIYIQVLDNLVEWIKGNQEKNNDILKCLIFVDMYFILYHTTFLKKEKKYFIKSFNDKLDIESDNFDSTNVRSFDLNEPNKKYKINFYESFDKYFNNLEKKILTRDSLNNYKEYLKENKNLYRSKYLVNYLDIGKNIDEKTFQKINNFIETGILINE